MDFGVFEPLHNLLRGRGRNHGGYHLGWRGLRLCRHGTRPRCAPPLRARGLGLVANLTAQRQLFLVTEPQGTPLLSAEDALSVRPRRHSPRAWGDIPDSELLAAAARVQAHLKCIGGCDDHLKGIATFFAIPRLTAPFKSHLTELLQAQA